MKIIKGIIKNNILHPESIPQQNFGMIVQEGNFIFFETQQEAEENTPEYSNQEENRFLDLSQKEIDFLKSKLAETPVNTGIIATLTNSVKKFFS